MHYSESNISKQMEMVKDSFIPKNSCKFVIFSGFELCDNNDVKSHLNVVILLFMTIEIVPWFSMQAEVGQHGPSILLHLQWDHS